MVFFSPSFFFSFLFFLTGLNKLLRFPFLYIFKQSFSWQAHPNDVSCIEFNSTGKQIASGGADKVVRVWESGAGQEIAKLHGCQAAVITCKWSPNGAYLCAAGNDCSIHLWNIRTQRQIRVFNGHSNKVTSIAFSSDSRRLFSGSHDRTIRIWDTETAACRYTLPAHSSVNVLDMSPDEYYLASAHLDGCIRFWSWRDKKELFVLKDHQPNQTNGVQFSPPDGIHVLTSSKDGTIICWDLRKKKQLYTIQHKEYKNSSFCGKPTYSPDGQYILAGSTIESKIERKKYPLFIWNTKDGKLLHQLCGHDHPVTGVTWHGRGGVASCDRGGVIATWM